jgi:CubicO group peptidase (beta-lactamase class C family)
MRPSDRTRLAIALFLLTMTAAARAADRGGTKAKSAPGGFSPRTIVSIDQAIESEMQRQQLVGVAVGVIKGGRVVFTKGDGFADKEKQVPVTTRTVFNWASNSKPLAAVAAMQLIEKKKLNLDADVRKYVPEVELDKTPITVRQLLCHQSGLPHWNVGTAVPDDKFDSHAVPSLDPLVTLHSFNRSPLLFPPGTRVSYSSYAYILLSAVIARAGGEPFPTQIEERIAKPLGLESLQMDVATGDQSDWAVGYTKTGTAVVPAKEFAHAWKMGAGAFKSNIEDFAKWGAALINHKVVSKDAETKMWAPQKLASGEPTEWGLGFSVNKSRRRVMHTGQQQEGISIMILNLNFRSGIVVLCNCGFGSSSNLEKAVEAALEGRAN